MGTVLPFSAISGRSSRTRPSVAVLPPVNFLIRSSASFLAANAGAVAPPKPAAARAAALSVKTLRRSKVRGIFGSPDIASRLRCFAHKFRSQDIFIYLQVSSPAPRQLQVLLSEPALVETNFFGTGARQFAMRR